MFIGCTHFTLTAIDFLGPYKVKAMTNACLQMKVWPVVFGCLNTGAVHIKLNKDYGTDALLLSITSFTSIRGYPAKFYTDKGTQLSKAGSFIDSKETLQIGHGTRSKTLLLPRKWKLTIVFLVASGRMVQLNNEFEP